MNFKNDLFFLLTLFFSIRINSMLESVYTNYPIVHTVNEVPLTSLRTLGNSRLLFYFAIQHKKEKKKFFIINPNVEYPTTVGHLAYQAMLDGRLFPAFVLNDCSFLVTNFYVINELEQSLLQLKKELL